MIGAMAMTGYERIKKWRERNKTYSPEYMRERRAHFRKLYLKRKIAYDDIPKAYRYFADTL